MTQAPPPHNPRWDTSKSMQDLVMLAAYVKGRKFIFSCVFALITAITLYFYHTHTYYSSRITFLVNSSNVAEVLWDRSNDGPIDVVNDDRGYNRINQIIYSSQMMDYLVTQFDLYTHYKIPEKVPDSYLAVTNRLKRSLSVTIGKTKIITVQVTDGLDYNVTANMANAIGRKINDINRQITVENLTRKTDMFETLSKDLKASSSKEFSQLDSLLKNMQRFLAGSIHDDAYRQLLSMNIDNLQSKSDSYFKDLFESYKYRLYSMYSLQEKNLPTISILEKALPNRRSKDEMNKMVYPLIVVFSFMVTIMFGFLFMKINPMLGYIFRKSSEAKKQ